MRLRNRVPRASGRIPPSRGGGSSSVRRAARPGPARGVVGAARRLEPQGQFEHRLHLHGGVVSRVPDEERRRAGVVGEFAGELAGQRLVGGVAEQILPRTTVGLVGHHAHHGIAEDAEGGPRGLPVDGIGGLRVAIVAFHAGRQRQVAAGRTAHHAHALGIDLEPLVVMPHQPQRPRHVTEHDGMSVALAAQPIAEHEGGDAAGVEPFGVVAALVIGEAAVAAAGADDDRGRGGGCLWRRPPGDDGHVVIGLARRTGRVVLPEADRLRRRGGHHRRLGGDSRGCREADGGAEAQR